MTDRHLRIPADRCYWALMPALNGARRPNRVQLQYQFETYLPLPIADVQCAFVTLADGRTIACALGHPELHDLIEQHPDAHSITPAGLPAFITDAEIDTDRLNLRTGDFEPPILERQRSMLAIHAATAILVITAAIAITLNRKTDAANAAFSRATVALDTERRRVLGGAPSSTQDPALLMMAELDTLRRTRTASTPGAEQPVTTHLVALFDAWPNDLRTRAETIVVANDTISLSALLEANDAAETLRESLTAMEDWQLAQPRLNRQRDDVRVTLRMTRTGETP